MSVEQKLLQMRPIVAFNFLALKILYYMQCSRLLQYLTQLLLNSVTQNKCTAYF